LDAELFTVENDLLTPSFKVKRHEVKKKYQKQIDALYAEIASSTKE
jgi:long-chain acyl-CoA synthetase